MPLSLKKAAYAVVSNAEYRKSGPLQGQIVANGNKLKFRIHASTHDGRTPAGGTRISSGYRELCSITAESRAAVAS
jgi:hypothetical protein